ncbi:hypothetical protein ATE84_3429 [Aquimarina sp. MAR_2010_214]|nr:hypothetical protein ATE84_3429 [Aquimarina sp. MAR_2010_214]
METHFTITKGKMNSIKLLITRVLSKWMSNYVKAMSKALYPSETKKVSSKNDRHRILHK